MTAPISNPSFHLKIQRVRRTIKALTAEMIKPGVDVAALRAVIAGHEAEITRICNEYVKTSMAGFTPDRSNIYGRSM
jgi:hypothetical protein